MVVEDIVHGNIKIDESIEKIIKTKDFQRLQDIIQTGHSYYNYPGLKNETRYDHSVGAMYVIDKIITNIEQKLNQKGLKISEEQKQIAKVAMLLHDIGHAAYSHTAEKITGYSHEKRGIDIIEDETTEIHQVLEQEYGVEFVQKVISFLSETYVEKNKKTDLVKINDGYVDLKSILKTLVSNNIDADKLDYLIRDSKSAGFQVLTNIDKLVDSIEPIIEGDNLTVGIPEEGMYLMETMLFERARNYLKIYYSDSITDKILFSLINRIKENPNLADILQNGTIKDFLSGKERKYTNNEYMQLTDTQLNEAIKLIGQKTEDKVLGNLCDLEECTKDFVSVDTDKSTEYVKYLLRKAIPELNLEKTDALIDETRTVKVYKKDGKENTNIITKGGVKDFADLDHLIDIKPKKKRTVALNPKLIAAELGVSDKEDTKLLGQKINQVIKELERAKDETELKYIIQDNSINYESMKSLLSSQFEFLGERKFFNDDVYYDNVNDWTFLRSNENLRIRYGKEIKTSEIGNANVIEKLIGYKKKKNGNSEYSFNQNNSEQELGDSLALSDYREFLRSNDIKYDGLKPTIRVQSLRKLFSINIDGTVVNICFNNSLYQNYLYGNLSGNVNTIEIQMENKRPEDNIVLAKLKEFLEESLPQMQDWVTNASIYEYAFCDTYGKYQNGYIDGMSKNQQNKIQEFETSNPEPVLLLDERIEELIKRNGFDKVRQMKKDSKRTELFDRSEMKRHGQNYGEK